MQEEYCHRGNSLDPDKSAGNDQEQKFSSITGSDNYS